MEDEVALTGTSELRNRIRTSVSNGWMPMAGKLSPEDLKGIMDFLDQR